MGAVALPQLPQQGRGFAHALSCFHRVHAGHKPFIFIGICAARDSKFDPAVSDQISRCRFARKLDRVPERCHDSASPKLDVFGVVAQVDKRQKRVRCDGKVHAVMFASPYRAHAALISHFRKRNQLFAQVVVLLIR